MDDPAVLSAGVLAGARLDPRAGNLSAYGIPAIVADVDPASSTSAYCGTVGTTTGAWTGSTSIYTDTNPSAWSLATSAYAVDLTYLQSPTGAIGHVQVDNQYYPAFSSYSPQAAPYRLYLDGQAHTVAVGYQSDAVLGAPLLSGPTDTGGTPGLAAALTFARNGDPVLNVGFPVNAISNTAVVFGPVGFPVLTLAIGQTASFGGYTVGLAAGTWDSTSTATFTITPPSLTLNRATTYAALQGGASYTSPVLDSGAQGSAWPFLECAVGPLAAPLPTLQLGIGESAIPDASWTWTALNLSAFPDALGNPWQRVTGGGNAARGRYSQFVVTLVSPQIAWVGDLRAYSWLPESDPFAARLPSEIFGGPNGRIVVGALAALYAYLDELAAEAYDGLAISTAQPPALFDYGRQFNLPRRDGEPTAAYRGRLIALLAGRRDGGSQPFLQQTLTGALGVPVTVAPFARNQAAFTLGTSRTGGAALGRSQSGKWRWLCQIPLAGLPVAPETARQIVGRFRPLGTVPTIQFI